MMICITVFHPIITCRQTIKRSYYMPTQHCLFVAAVTVIIMLALSQMCKSHSPSTRKIEILAMAMRRGIFCSGLCTFLRVVMAELRPLKPPTIKICNLKANISRQFTAYFSIYKVGINQFVIYSAKLMYVICGSPKLMYVICGSPLEVKAKG